MSATGKAPSARADEPRVIPAPRERQLNHRQWTEMVNAYLPAMWTAVSADQTPLELRHEACALAWLRLAQRKEIVPGEQTGTWLVMTARVEAQRAVARHELTTQQRLSSVPRQEMS